MNSANLFIHQVMWFCSSPPGNTHYLGMSSRIMISGCRFFIIHMTQALVRVTSLSRPYVAAFGISNPYRNTSGRSFIGQIWKAASVWLDFLYAWLRSIITRTGSSELALQRFPSWWIRSAKWFRRCIFTKLKSDLSTSCCAISDSICI